MTDLQLSNLMNSLTNLATWYHPSLHRQHTLHDFPAAASHTLDRPFVDSMVLPGPNSTVTHRRFPTTLHLPRDDNGTSV